MPHPNRHRSNVRNVWPTEISELDGTVENKVPISIEVFLHRANQECVFEEDK